MQKVAKKKGGEMPDSFLVFAELLWRASRGNGVDSRRAVARVIEEAFPAKTQSERAARAARALGVSESTVINYIKCDSDMKLRTVGKLAAAATVERFVMKPIEGR